MKTYNVISILALVFLVSCGDATGAKTSGNNANNTANNANNGSNNINNSDACGVDACLGGAPICDASRLVCVECAQDSHCGLAEPACDLDGECRECTDDSFCSGERSVCNLDENECQVPCTAAADCEGDTPFCDTDAGRCVECEGDQNCENQETCSALGVCIECSTDAECGGEDPFCRVAEGKCVECQSAADCGNGSACVDFECVECSVDSDCPVAAPICVADNQCEVCSEEDNRGCSGDTPLCDGGEVCVECIGDDDCNGDLKCENDVCVPD